MATDFVTPNTVQDHVGETLVSDWITISQDMINRFGEVTRDPDPHHVDPEFCREHSPWGKPISFGFLTLSLMTPMAYQVYRYPLDGPAEKGYPASYGFKKMRFVESVPVDSRIRGHFTIESVGERKPGQKLVTFGVLVEIEGRERPALVGQWESLWITPEN